MSRVSHEKGRFGGSVPLIFVVVKEFIIYIKRRDYPASV